MCEVAARRLASCLTCQIGGEAESRTRARGFGDRCAAITLLPHWRRAYHSKAIPSRRPSRFKLASGPCLIHSPKLSAQDCTARSCYWSLVPAANTAIDVRRRVPEQSGGRPWSRATVPCGTQPLSKRRPALAELTYLGGEQSTRNSAACATQPLSRRCHAPAWFTLQDGGGQGRRTLTGFHRNRLANGRDKPLFAYPPDWWSV